jgi:hypothetical protein
MSVFAKRKKASSDTTDKTAVRSADFKFACHLDFHEGESASSFLQNLRVKMRCGYTDGRSAVKKLA